MSIRIIQGDCVAVMAGLQEASVDAICTDPPYELGFMGKSWDKSGVAFSQATWREALRVLKPGGHLLAFSGTRTYHRMVCAIEDAGFEIRDQIGWVYGSGFPKSLDVSKAIDKAGGDALAWRAFSEAYAAAVRNSALTHADIDRALGIKSSSCYWARTDHRGGMPPRIHWEKVRQMLALPAGFARLYDEAEREVIGQRDRGFAPGTNAVYGDYSGDTRITAPATEAARQWEGWGTALKPAWEPIVLARKPLAGTVAANVLQHGTGALNIDGCKVGTESTRRPVGKPLNGGAYGSDRGGMDSLELVGGSDAGRWPANLIHDGSDEVLAAFPQAPGQQATASSSSSIRKDQSVYSGPLYRGSNGSAPRGDTGSAARFYYSAKASKHDRNDGLGCNCEEQWAKEDRAAITRQATGTRPRRATTGSTKAGGSEWPTSSSGSGTTDLFQQDTRSTTSTTTSSTTTPEISSPSTPQPTSESTAGANCAPVSGGSHASSAAPSSPSTEITGTSARKDGHSMDDVGHATSPESSATRGSDGRCANCGQLIRSTHPTVKPTDLMRYLCRLITPPGGTVLDPFCGSGSTLKAAELEGFSAIGIELDPAYVEIARRRIGADAPLFRDVSCE